MEVRPIQFVDSEIGFEIRAEIMYIDLGAAGTLAMPLATFQRAHSNSGRVIRQYYAGKAKVIPLHAARS